MQKRAQTIPRLSTRGLPQPVTAAATHEVRSFWLLMRAPTADRKYGGRRSDKVVRKLCQKGWGMPTDQAVDYYEILQISPTAEPETVHRVYRLLAQRFHPDNGETGNDAQFRTLS